MSMKSVMRGCGGPPFTLTSTTELLPAKLLPVTVSTAFVWVAVSDDGLTLVTIGIGFPTANWIRRPRETNTMVDRVQVTRLDGPLPRWQVRDIKVYTSQLRYALHASEEQIQEAVKLKPGQQMLMDLYLG